MRVTRSLLLIAGLSLSGCVQYTPVELAAIPPGEEVRVTVTDEGALRLARRLGRITNDVTASVAAHASDSLAVTIWLGRDYPGTDFANVRETVVFPRYEVVGLRRRELSKWRTAALSAAALAGTFILADQIFQIGDPNRRGDDDPEPPPGDLVLLRVFLPWTR